MYTVYIIQSERTGRYYVGYTSNMENRLQEHNGGKTKSLRNQGPFKIVYREEFAERSDAYRRERQIKSYKGGNAFNKLVEKAF